MNRLRLALEVLRGRSVVFNVDFASPADMVVNDAITIQDCALMQGGTVNGQQMHQSDSGRVRLSPPSRIFDSDGR